MQQTELIIACSGLRFLLLDSPLKLEGLAIRNEIFVQRAACFYQHLDFGGSGKKIELSDPRKPSAHSVNQNK